MKTIVVMVTCLLLTGCSSGSNNVLDVLSKRNVVVLSSHEVKLTETPVEFKSDKPMKISGSMSSFCFVIKDGVPLQDMNAMDRIFADAIGGTQISSILVLSTGERVPLSKASFSWSGDGVVLKDGELAACAVPSCGTTLPMDAIVSKVEVSSVPAFTVKGMYWKSERDPSEPLVPSLATKSTSQSASSQKCSG